MSWGSFSRKSRTRRFTRSGFSVAADEHNGARPPRTGSLTSQRSACATFSFGIVAPPAIAPIVRQLLLQVPERLNCARRKSHLYAQQVVGITSKVARPVRVVGQRLNLLFWPCSRVSAGRITRGSSATMSCADHTVTRNGSPKSVLACAGASSRGQPAGR